MTPPPVYVGPATQERCAKAHEECAAAKASKLPLRQVAEQFGVARSTLRAMCQAHAAMRTYPVQLARAGSATLPVCTVVTPKGPLAAAIAAVRTYPGTLKSLELPDWQLLVGGRSFPLDQVRAEMTLGGGR